MTDFADMPKLSSTGKTILGYNINLPANGTHNYAIQIKYLSSDTVDQSDDMEKEVSGKIYAEEGTNPTLAQAMLKDNPTISERTSFSSTNVANTTGTIYKTNKTEDGSEVYYYSGNTTNNWVKFGGFYWRIIRTNEDGSVRMLYSGTSPDTTEGYIGTSTFNTSSSVDPMYGGYMYGTSGSLDSNRANTNDSTIKTYIDTWYENNLLTNYDKYISKTAIYCNDRSVPDSNYSMSSEFEYGASKRSAINYTPTYKCGGNGTDGLFESTQAIADKFSASTTGGGNGKLKYPIALMTPDEISFAGGVSAIDLSSPYTWYYTNSINSAIVDKNWWLLSPLTFSPTVSSSKSYISIVGSGSNTLSPLGGIFTNPASNVLRVRPAISLSSCVKVTGNGTPASPYEIDYDGSCM